MHTQNNNRYSSFKPHVTNNRLYFSLSRKTIAEVCNLLLTSTFIGNYKECIEHTRDEHTMLCVSQEAVNVIQDYYYINNNVFYGFFKRYNLMLLGEQSTRSFLMHNSCQPKSRTIIFFFLKPSLFSIPATPSHSPPVISSFLFIHL